MKFLAFFLIAAMVPFVGAEDRSERRNQSHTFRYCTSCERTATGRIKRSSAARATFKRQSPFPATGRPTGAGRGYVIDHIRALKHGGNDTPQNMQWQTVEQAKA